MHTLIRWFRRHVEVTPARRGGSYRDGVFVGVSYLPVSGHIFVDFKLREVECKLYLE